MSPAPVSPKSRQRLTTPFTFVSQGGVSQGGVSQGEDAGELPEGERVEEHSSKLSMAPLAREIVAAEQRKQRRSGLMMALVAGAAVAGAMALSLFRVSAPQAAPLADVANGGQGETNRPSLVAQPMTSESGSVNEGPTEGAADAPFALEFNEDAAKLALRHRARSIVRSCDGKVPARATKLSITFSASGKATAVNVVSGPSIASTSCFVQQLGGVAIPAFKGAERTVTMTITDLMRRGDEPLARNF